MTESEAHSSFTKHRKVACSFRDTKLYDIFLLAVNLLSTARNNKALDFRVEPQQGYVNPYWLPDDILSLIFVLSILG